MTNEPTPAGEGATVSIALPSRALLGLAPDPYAAGLPGSWPGICHIVE